VLFDSPPTGAVADASILAAKVDGAILVIDAGRTRTEALRNACETLSRSKTRVLGAVLDHDPTTFAGP
jgi:Mrp family chromosome partitioning ATPase